MPAVAKLLWSLDLDVEEISKKSGLRQQRVLEILETDNLEYGELRALSRGLKIPLNAFAKGKRPTDFTEELNLLFRSPGEPSELEPTKEFVASYVDATLQLLGRLNRAPDWLSTIPKIDQTIQHAEELANFIRDIFYGTNSISPLTDLAVILNELGGVIVGKLRNSKYEGASLIAGGRPFIFVSPRFSGRMLFTLAHELGHIVAHHVHRPSALFEKTSDIARVSRKNKSDEVFVDAFASSLLLPAQGVGRLLKHVKEAFDQPLDGPIGDIDLLYLARFYGVSFEVAGIRCENLGLMPQGATMALYQRLRGDFGSPEKRADDVGLPKREELDFPDLSPSVRDAVVEQIIDGTISSGWASDKFGLSLQKIYSMHKELIDADRT